MQGRWFIGVDLAWGERNASGFAALSPGRRGLRLRESAALGPLEAIAERIRRLPGDWVIAIDAPLIVPNETGSRPCDREVSRQYGSRHAGAYPASLRKGTIYESPTVDNTRAWPSGLFSTVAILPPLSHHAIAAARD